MVAALGLLKVALRRMTAAGWRGYALAAAVLIAAVAALSVFAGPSPATDRLVFSVSGSSSRNPTVWIGSGGGGELKVESSGGDRENPPLQPEVPAGSTTINPPPFLVPPPSTEKLSTNEGPISLMEADWLLIYAKKEIGRSRVISDDPDLYASLFRNVSVFKRSYELMEKLLKVYIYRDGQRPIFHTFMSVLKGIYASEGWFMKLMESNRNFVVKDLRKAHLFYLPYSARQLEVTLYKPDSHNLRPLAIFLKNYVVSISARYPFWNRTRGADHFLVACHDWGPYTTRLHAELEPEHHQSSMQC